MDMSLVRHQVFHTHRNHGQVWQGQLLHLGKQCIPITQALTINVHRCTVLHNTSTNTTEGHLQVDSTVMF